MIKRIKYFFNRLVTGLAFIFKSSGADYIVIYRTKDDIRDTRMTYEYNTELNKNLVMQMLNGVINDKELFTDVDVEYN